MRKFVLSVLVLCLLPGAVFARQAVESQETAMKKAEKAPKTAQSAAPKTDSDIQKCIEGKLAKSDKLRVQGFIVRVNDGEATFEGKAQNAGSKGAATRIAQSCGARTVNNKLSAPAIPNPKKKAESENKN